MLKYTVIFCLLLALPLSGEAREIKKKESSFEYRMPTEEEQTRAIEDCKKQQLELYESMKNYKPDLMDPGKKVTDYSDDFSDIERRLSRVVTDYEMDLIMVDDSYKKLKTRLIGLYEDEMKSDIKKATPSMKVRYADMTKEVSENRMRAMGIQGSLRQVVIERDAYKRILRAGATTPLIFPDYLIELTKKTAELQKKLIPLQIQQAESWNQMPQMPQKLATCYNCDPDAQQAWELKMKKYQESLEPVRQEIQELQEELSRIAMEQQILITAIGYENGYGYIQDPNTLIKMYEPQNGSGGFNPYGIGLGMGGYPGGGMMGGGGYDGGGCAGSGFVVSPVGGLGGGYGGGVPVWTKNKNVSSCHDCGKY